MERALFSRALIIALTVAICAGAQSAGKTQVFSVGFPSLEGNLRGDPTTLEFSVSLPLGQGDDDRRYPVVYQLAGFGFPPMTQWPESSPVSSSAASSRV